MSNPPNKYLVFDMSNVMHRNYYANKDEPSELAAGLAAHSVLITMAKYYKMINPTKIICVFDRSSWRKEYTASDQCLSKKPYKGNRRQNMTPGQQAKYASFKHHVKDFEQLITDHTSVVTLAKDRLEADDLIAGIAQTYGNEDNEVVIISADSDLLQLVRYKNVSVISPITDKPQSLADYNGDPLYYLFQKEIRGDSSDNVASAFPRVRSTRIKAAYDDEYERVKLMKETWTNENGTEFVVEDLIKENELLIDLEKQPADIRILIDNTITEEMARKRQFSMFHMLRFAGKYKLKKIQESIDNYVHMLSR